MLEFPEQVLELSMPVGRGTKGPPMPPVGSDTTILIWGPFLISLALLDVVERSFLTVWELSGVPPSVRPTVRL